jgi:hypothetical protein
MSCIRSLLFLAVLAAVSPCSRAAEEKKDGKTNEPPKVIGAFPFAVSAGATNKFKVRGLSLTNATALRFPTAEKLSAEIKSRGKATVPEKADAKKVGDTQLEVELTLPNDFPPGDLLFFVNTPEGDTGTNRMRVVESKLLLDEKEPNGAFRKPNQIKVPQTVRGLIEAANDVDVFQFVGKVGQKLRVESLSVAYGSSLDPIVTLHDSKGHVLATSDDASGSADASLRFIFTKDGDYFLSVIDAHDRGGPTYGYLLVFREE